MMMIRIVNHNQTLYDLKVVFSPRTIQGYKFDSNDGEDDHDSSNRFLMLVGSFIWFFFKKQPCIGSPQ